MTLFEIIKEEWGRLTLFGRVTWFPFFLISFAPVLALAPIAFPLYLLIEWIEKKRKIDFFESIGKIFYK